MTTKKPAAKKAAPKKPPTRTRTNRPAPKLPPKHEGAGRPTKFTTDYCELTTNYCLMGATDQELAGFLGISVATLYNWKKDHPEFLEAMSKGREAADARVARSLYHRALGYSHPEDDIRTVSIGGGQSEIVVTPTIKHYPPDTAAASLWLRNRQPERWRDKVEVEHGGRLSLEQLPQEELEAQHKELLARMGLVAVETAVSKNAGRDRTSVPKATK